MLRVLALSMLAMAVSVPALVAQDGQESEHAFAVNGMEIIHPWARAASAGDDTLVFFELHNEGGADRLLGASSAVAEAVHIVGLTMGGDGVDVQEVGEIDIPAGEFAFDPGGLALELDGLEADLVQGGHFELILEFANAGAIEIEIAVEAADAGQHSHAGHSH